LSSLRVDQNHKNTERALEQSRNLPTHHYFTGLFESYGKAYQTASNAKKRGIDLAKEPESQEVCDLADRLEAMTGIEGIAKRLRTYDPSLTPYDVALKLAEDIALGQFGFLNKDQILNLAIRAGLYVVMSSVRYVPAEDITKVVIKKNGDGTSYPSLLFGQIIGVISPLQASFLLLLVDKVRLMIGLEKYHVNSTNDDEIARFLEELGIYERELGPIEPQVSENDIRLVLQNIPVEIDGRGTENLEVTVNRNLQRISGNRIRGGALHVLIQGVIGKSSKVLQMAKALQIVEWDWLSSINIKERPQEPENLASYILNAKPGRPVLSLPDVPGAFRLRYGRAENSGFGSFGFHPALLELLDSPLSTGTQVKISLASFLGSVATVDTLCPPTIRLHNGDVCIVTTAVEAKSLRDHLDTVIHLGDVLISPSELLRSGRAMEPSAYIEEWWASDVQEAINQRHLSLQQLSALTSIDLELLSAETNNPLSSKPSLSEAVQLCNTLGIPLHPRFTYFWDLLTIKDVFSLRDAIVDYKEDSSDFATLTIVNSVDIKRILETAGIPHKVSGSLLKIQGDDAKATYLTLAPTKSIPLGMSYSDTIAFLKSLSGLNIRKKSSTNVGVAMRKVEVANERKMRPPVHSLFPTGLKGNPSRDMLQSQHASTSVELSMRACPSCGAHSPYSTCPFCDSKTTQLYYCPSCNKEQPTEQCPDCKCNTLPYATVVPHTLDLLRAASETVGLQAYPPLKGVAKLTNRSRSPERLEKGILRQRHNLTCFKDGTTRYDTVNAPLTHFKPSQFHMDIKTLQDLGYLTDQFGKPLEFDDQIIELKPQDVILPLDSADHFKRLSSFLDDLLARFFKSEIFYDIQKQRDLIGTLVVGISPRASVGVIGRVIGFTDGRVCFAHPFWHAAKHRDCSGDIDSLTLLLDVFLNYSPSLCPDYPTGLLDTPFLIEPIVLSSDAKKLSAFDTMTSYPQDFYTGTIDRPSAKALEETLLIKQANTNSERNLSYTHWSSLVVSSQPRSSYSNPGSMPDKVSKQIAVASKIRTVDVDGLISSLLNNYLVKEIIANLDAYSIQKFRCKGCGETYRRPPLKGTCLTCGRELVPSLTLS